MGLLENILKGVGLDSEITPYCYRYMIFGNSGGCFEGIKSIKSFSTTEVVVIIKEGDLIIKGKNLRIKKYLENEVCLSGEIVEVVKNVK